MAGTLAMRGTAIMSASSGCCFWIMLILAVPTVALSGMFAMILGYRLPDVPALMWVSPVLGRGDVSVGVGGRSSSAGRRRSGRAGPG